MKKTTLLLLIIFIGSLAGQQAMAQGNFLKKLKKKAEEKAIEGVFGEEENDNNTNTYGTSDSNANAPKNTTGSGLTTEAPDVMANIKDAEDNFDKKQYADARFSVRQAILGIELEIGNNILEGFPESINGLPAIEEEDQVASTGIGFVGLVIARTYREDNKQFKVTVGNETALMAGVSIYMGSDAYVNTQDQGHKSVKVGDNRGIIEFDESTGYRLTVPFGQSSVLITEGINFETEDEMMDATEEVGLENIKKELGEE